MLEADIHNPALEVPPENPEATVLQVEGAFTGELAPFTIAHWQGIVGGLRGGQDSPPARPPASGPDGLGADGWGRRLSEPPPYPYGCSPYEWTFIPGSDGVGGEWVIASTCRIPAGTFFQIK